MRPQQTTLTKSYYGQMPDGRQVDEYTLSNPDGIAVKFITYGGRINSIKMLDKEGKNADIVLGYNNLEGYLNDDAYLGALVGRFSNRIKNGIFSLDGHTYTLAKNNGPNHLHGGKKGFDAVLWSAKEIHVEDGAAVKLSYTSVDGEEGYPGTLNVSVTYQLKKDNNLEVSYAAETDQKTIINLTQHSYFNLSGSAAPVLDSYLKINASKFLAVDATLIPTVEKRSVQQTPFDFTSFKKMGAEINAANQQLQYGSGYDHCWIIDGEAGEMRKAAEAYDPVGGRSITVYTTEPGMQFYSGNFLDGSINGKHGRYSKNTGFCLETQHFPDSPNQPDFPEVVLEPGETYNSSTIYKFSVK